MPYCVFPDTPMFLKKFGLRKSTLDFKIREETICFIHYYIPSPWWSTYIQNMFVEWIRKRNIGRKETKEEGRKGTCAKLHTWITEDSNYIRKYNCFPRKKKFSHKFLDHWLARFLVFFPKKTMWEIQAQSADWISMYRSEDACM